MHDDASLMTSDRECLEKNTACSHFLHDIKARSFRTPLSRGGRGNCAGTPAR
jgi:hypothetical protein